MANETLVSTNRTFTRLFRDSIIPKSDSLLKVIPTFIEKPMVLVNSSELQRNESSLGNSSFDMRNVTTGYSGQRLCPYEDSQAIQAAKASAYCVVMLISFISNVLVVMVVAKNRRMRTAVNMFIVNMAISDLLITVFFMPRMLSRIFMGIEWAVTGTPGLVLCKISPSMQELCSCLSVLMFIAVAVERFIAVLMPLKTLVTKKVSYFLSAGIWILAIAIRFPSFYSLKLFELNSNVYCAYMLEDPIADTIYRHFSFITFYAVPLCIAITLYSGVILALKRRIQPGNGNRLQHNVQLRRTYKILKMLVTVVITFTVCWFLYFCLPVLSKEMDYSVLCFFFFPRFFLSHLNCAINPMIYLVCIQNYRRSVRAMFIRAIPRTPTIKPRQNVPQGYEMTRL